ncbi:MAG: alpha/beta hydrolase, partial [Leptospira sp.]|nr:alpha/beta hydrolase [Leptospira sp.]
SISKPETRKLIDSIMLIGAYSDFLDTLPFVFSNYHRDNYGVYVLLFNFIEAIEPKLAGEIKLLAYEAACDNALHRAGEKAIVPKILKEVSEPARTFFYQIDSNEDFRTIVGEKIAKAVGNLPHQLSPYHQLETIECPVVLLHGEDDPVISPEESKKLSMLLSKKQIPFLYRTSSAITHGDNLPIHSQIFGIPAILETFGTFIQNMKP